MTTPDLELTYDNPDVAMRGAHRPGALRLPAPLLESFEIVEQLDDEASEGWLLRVRRRPDATAPAEEAVYKLYGTGLEERADVLARIHRKAYAHVVTLLDYGTVEGVGYELLEWIGSGTLSDLVEGSDHPLPEAAALDVVRELSEAIAAFHELAPPAELAHGDIRPANILVRTTSPLDLVLADFGRATTIPRRRQLPPHPRWSNPGDGVTTPQGDWWSLGCIVYWLRTGRLPYHELDGDADAAIIALKETGRLFPADHVSNTSRDWRRLVQGLTTRNKFDRWGHDEVTQWLGGGSPPLGDEWSPPEVITVTVDAPKAELTPIRWGGADYHSPQELAVGLARRWDAAAKLLGSREGTASLLHALVERGREAHDLDLVNDVMRILGDDATEAQRLARLITRLDPGVVPVLGPYELSRRGIAGLCDKAAARSAPESRALATLDQEQLLTAYAAPSRELDLLRLELDWDAEMALWERCRTRNGFTPTGEDREFARARTLHALVDPTTRARLQFQARRAGDRRSRRVDWYAEIRAQAGRPGASVALIQLAPAAQQAATALAAQRDAQAGAAWQARLAANDQRVPRTRTRLGWVLWVGLVLSLASVMLHLLPGWGNATFVTGEQWLTFWDRVVPEALRPWLATATLPILTIPPTLVGFLLWWRAAPTSRGAQTRRHPLERRASQAVIAYFSLLVPPMLPFTAYGWVAGLREYASADLFRARAPRTVALMTGTVALTGALLALWQIPYLSFGSFPGTPMFDYLYTGAQWAAQSGWTDRLLAPWYISLVSPYDQAAVGAYLGATAQVAAVAGACLLLGGYGYVRYNGTIATLLVILSVPSATVALFAVFAYGFLGQYWFVDVAYALVAAFYIRHRLRNRRRTRPGGTT